VQSKVELQGIAASGMGVFVEAGVLFVELREALDTGADWLLV